MTYGFKFSACCKRCEGWLELVSAGGYAGTESKAVARCVDCHARWLICVTLRVADGRAA